MIELSADRLHPRHPDVLMVASCGAKTLISPHGTPQTAVVGC